MVASLTTSGGTESRGVRCGVGPRLMTQHMDGEKEVNVFW